MSLEPSPVGAPVMYRNSSPRRGISSQSLPAAASQYIGKNPSILLRFLVLSAMPGSAWANSEERGATRTAVTANVTPERMLRCEDHDTMSRLRRGTGKEQEFGLPSPRDQAHAPPCAETRQRLPCWNGSRPGESRGPASGPARRADPGGLTNCSHRDLVRPAHPALDRGAAPPATVSPGPGPLAAPGGGHLGPELRRHAGHAPNHPRYPAHGSLFPGVQSPQLRRHHSALHLPRRSVHRQERDAVRVLDLIDQAIARGDGVILFAEGTTSSGQALLPMRPALFDWAARKQYPVNYAALTYRTPPGDPPAHMAVGWWGEMPFGPHLLNLCRIRGFEATVEFGPAPLPGGTRGELAQQAGKAIAERFVPVWRSDPRMS